MAEGTSNIGDLFGMFGGANPIAAVGKSLEQFRRAVDDLLRAVEVFTDTMDTLNHVAGRVNRLLDDVEEPIRTIVPQISATVKLADGMVNQLIDPVERITPLLSMVSDTLGAASFSRLPEQLGEFVDALGDVSKRLAPLGQMLDSAGGLFRMGPLRNLLGVAGLPDAPVPPPPPPPPPAPTTTRTKQPTTKKTAAAAAAKPTPVTPTPVKNAAAKKSAAKKSVAKKSAAKNAAAKNAAATKPVTAKNAATKKPAAKRA